VITSFGSINLDFVVALPRLPRPGETVSGPDHQTFPGGKGANQALAARRAGADVKMVGAVGRDPFAELALANLRAAGVDLSGVRALDGTTGLAFIGVEPSGENQIMVASGTNKRVSAAWLKDALHPGEILMMQGEVPGPEVTIAIEAAHAAGARIFLNPAPIPDKAYAGLARSVDVLVVNEGEAEAIGAYLGLPGDPAGFVKALVTAERLVAVTLGSDGVVAGRGTDVFHIRPPKVEVRDTTGAGDAFCGALAAALNRETPLERALCEAIAAGSLACGATGAQSSAPEAREIAALADTLRAQ
jgi:ribokinase